MHNTGKLIVRWIIYIVGMTVLALGLTLNTMTGLGASCLISPAYTASRVFNLNLGNVTLVWYVVFIAIQLIIRGKNRNWLDLLQFPLTFIMTRQMNFFKAIIPYRNGFIPVDILVLLIAIICTGIGAVSTINTKLIPNPGDGMVLAFSDVFKKDLGFCKNICDITCVVFSFVLGLIFGNPLTGVGIGTVIAAILTGRVMHFINKHFKEKIEIASGLR